MKIIAIDDYSLRRKIISKKDSKLKLSRIINNFNNFIYNNFQSRTQYQVQFNFYFHGNIVDGSILEIIGSYFLSFLSSGGN